MPGSVLRRRPWHARPLIDIKLAGKWPVIRNNERQSVFRVILLDHRERIPRDVCPTLLLEEGRLVGEEARSRCGRALARGPLIVSRTSARRIDLSHGERQIAVRRSFASLEASDPRLGNEREREREERREKRRRK